MADFFSEYYLWIKALHIMAIIAWMAGLFYLPRLFVYHTRVAIGSEQDKIFQTMELKLLRVIMNPAMILSWGFGAYLLMTPGVIIDGQYWYWVKIIAVILMSVFHMKLAGWRKNFAHGQNEKSESFFRKANEIPTLLMVIIVIMVVVKPF